MTEEILHLISLVPATFLFLAGFAWVLKKYERFNDFYEKNHDIREEVATVKEDVATLKEDMAVVKKDVATMRIEMTAMGKRMDAMGENIDKIIALIKIPSIVDSSPEPELDANGQTAKNSSKNAYREG